MKRIHALERIPALGHILLPILVAAALAGAATAGIDVDFGAAVPLGDDGNLFVSISSRYFDREPRVIEDWGRRYFPDPDDLAVALFLGRHCDRGPEFAFSLRQEGLGWFEISNRCRVPVDVFFVAVERDPGPPYGKAYGHWRKHRQDKRHAMVLDDDDVRRLVAARMIHEYYGVPMETAMKWRAGGRDVRDVMVGEYRQRHGKGPGRDAGHEKLDKDHRHEPDKSDGGNRGRSGDKGKSDDKGKSGDNGKSGDKGKSKDKG